MDKHGWRRVETLPEIELGDRHRVLLWSPRFGVRTGDAGKFRGQIYASVSNLHGNAIEDWGATHWQPVPPDPEDATDQ